MVDLVFALMTQAICASAIGQG